MITDFSIILLGLVALVWSADRFIEGAAAIAGRAGMSPLLIGMTIVSVGTSAPEILVSLMAALSNSGELAVGNALGSNIANIGLVLGITLLIAPIHVGRTTAFHDLPVLLIIVLLCAALLWDATLSSGDALVLLAALAVYLFRMARHVQAPDINDPQPTISEMPLLRAMATFAVGLLVLIGSSRALVWSAVNIAEGFGVSQLVIGLTIVALGTSLPELAASVVSAMKGHADIAIGAVVGSNMFNLLIVLALPGFFADLHLEAKALVRDLGTVMISTLMLAVFTWVSWQKTANSAGLGRFAGGSFLALYVVYYLLLFNEFQNP